MRFAGRITKVTDTHTHSMCNTNCFSTTSGYANAPHCLVMGTVPVLLLHTSSAAIVGFAVYVGNFSYKIAKQ